LRRRRRKKRDTPRSAAKGRPMPRPTPRATPLGPVEGLGSGEEVAGAPVWDVEGDAEDEPFGVEAAALDVAADEAEVPVVDGAAEVAVEEAADVWV
jgi:hypothetical protein